MDLRRYWNVVRRWWWLPLLGLLIGAGVGYLFSKQIKPVYRAEAYLYVNPVQTPGSPNVTDFNYAQTLAYSYSQLLRSRPILDDIGREFGVSVKTENIIVTPVPGAQFLSIVVIDPDPARAAAIANRLSDTLVRRTQDTRTQSVQTVRQQVDQDLNDARQRVTTASNRLDQLRATPTTSGDSLAETLRLHDELLQDQETYRTLLAMQQRMQLEQLQAGSSLTVTNRADIPTMPQPSAALATILRFGLIGLLALLGLAVLIEFFDDRFRDPEELRRRYNLVPLAVLDFAQSRSTRLLIDPVRPRSDRLTEALRLLRTNLEFAATGQPLVVCISSALRNEGKSTVVANLSIAEAQAGKRVILIDADLRDPSLHQFFDLGNDHGLSTVLAHSPHNDRVPLQDGPLGMKILTSGPRPSNPTELLGSHQLIALLRELQGQADIILLDTAPILPFADTLALQGAVPAIVLVLDMRRTGAKVLEQMLTALEQTPAKVLGAVLNKDQQRRGTYGYDGRRGPTVRAPVSTQPEAARPVARTVHGD